MVSEPDHKPEQTQNVKLLKETVPCIYSDKISKSQIVSNPSNKIKSTRYTWYNFLPITVAFQLTKVIVVFNLINVVLQAIPSISTNNPLASLIPTLFIIFMGILKELVNELKRLKNDKRVNGGIYSILTTSGKF